MDVGPLAETLAAMRAQNRSVLVAIDGFGGSGKSTLARELASAIPGSGIISFDDFIVKEHVLDDSWEQTWDRARLRDEVLEPLRDGRPAAFRRLDWVSNTLSAPIPMPPLDLLIVEGITTLHPELRAFWDYAIWVDAPVDVARERGRARDADTENAQHWDRWSRNDVRYLSDRSPDRAADVVFANG